MGTIIKLLDTWMGHPKDSEMNVTAVMADRLEKSGMAEITKRPDPTDKPIKRVRLLTEWMTRHGDDTLGAGKGQVLDMPKQMADRLIAENKAVDLDAKPRGKTTKKQVKEPPKNKAIVSAENK